jgi:hypothetical protein
LVQQCNQDTIMEMKVFREYTKGGGRVILKHDIRGIIALQNNCLLVTPLHQTDWLHLICSSDIMNQMLDIVINSNNK